MSIQTAIHAPVHDHSRERWRVTWSKLIPVIIIAAGMCAFANSFRGVFVLDDNDHILHDDTIRGLFPLNEHLFLPNERRWVSRLTFIMNYALRPQEVLSSLGPQGTASPQAIKPVGFHAVNLAIHMIAALALYGLVRRTLWLPQFGRRFAQSGSWIAMTCALFWMLHPLQTQSVTYIVQREEALMGMFYLLTLYGVVRGATAARGSWAWYTLAVAACFLGMGSKEVMVTAPLVVLLYDWTFLTPSGLKNPVRRAGLYVALFLSYATFIKLGTADVFNGKGTAGFNIPVGFGALAYALSQPLVILHYLCLCFWPYPLCLDYADWQPLHYSLLFHGAEQPRGLLLDVILQTILPAAVILMMFAASCWGLWKRHWLGFLGCAFFLILAPSSSIMPIHDLVMEHRMYLPLAAVVVAVVIGGWWALDYAERQEPLLHRSCQLMTWGLIGILTLLLGERTWLRNMDYASTVAIYQSVTEARPRNARGWRNYGMSLAVDKRFPEAIAALKRELRLFPGDVEGWTALATIYGASLDPPNPDAAIEYLRQGLYYAPKSDLWNIKVATANYNLGLLLHQKDPLNPDQSEALKHLRIATQLNPKFPDPWELIAQIEMYTDPQKAEKDFQQAIKLSDPAAAPTGHNNLASLYMRMGRYDEAVKEYKLALQGDPLYLTFRLNLGDAYVKTHQWEEARTMFSEVQRKSALGSPEYTEALADLGELTVATGKYKEGIADLRQAIQFSRGEHQSVEYTRRLAWVLATAPPPYRDPAQALSLAQNVNQQSGDVVAPFLNTLAAAYAANGRFQDALQASHRALDGAKQFQDLEQIRQSQEQIQAYGTGKIWTESATTQAPPLSPTTASSPN